jgi:hypothetical protein
MNNSPAEIDQWLIAGTQEHDQSFELQVWDANFDIERQLVYSKFGPYSKLFLRPEKFIQRFYHTLYPLLVEDWEVVEQLQLYEGFCTLDIKLEVRFQATLAYAQSQIEILSEINEHIKTTYQGVILDLIHNKLFAALPDDTWIQAGLGDIERAIDFAVSEMLVLNNIQAQTTCYVKVSFADFPDVQLGKEHLYLSVLKKNFEVNEQQREELFRQEQLAEEQSIAHKQQQLEQLKEQAELEQLKQAQNAEHKRRLLLDQEQQLQVQLAIEKRMYVQKVEHENELKAIEFEASLREQKRQAGQIRASEQKVQAEQLAHQNLLKEKQLHADIAKQEQEQASWLMAKNKEHELQLEHEQKQKQLKFDMDVANKKREEQRRIEMQEQNYEAKKNSDIYLRREIELLELDKKRLELEAAIKEVKPES